MQRMIGTLLTLFATACIAGDGTADDRVWAPDERAYSAFSDDKHRQFDFWIGQWDVNLRMLQDDLTFRDTIGARANIYSILNGKAILELWDSGPIKGYSLRHYDPQTGRWILWLNWPSRNRSAVSSLSGEFRHGRGEFRSEFTNADGQTITQRYSFNDITPFSLRWDDLNSIDGGKTWRQNWRMEFTRTAVEPHWPPEGTALPTYDTGARCDDAGFRPYESLVGRWQGRINEREAMLTAWHVLDGCAVAVFLDVGHQPAASRFMLLFYDTANERWEVNYLDDDRDSGMLRLVSGEDWRLTQQDDHSLRWDVANDALEYAYRDGDRVAESGRFERQ